MSKEEFYVAMGRLQAELARYARHMEGNGQILIDLAYQDAADTLAQVEAKALAARLAMGCRCKKCRRGRP